MESKWFLIDHEKKEIDPYREAINIEEAWEKSLEKWEWLSKGYIITFCISGCGLCDQFYSLECRGCPISTISNKDYCKNTPYTDYKSWRITPEQRLIAAQQELNFLKMVKEKTYGK